MYTAEVLVSPPNLARMKKAFGGFLDLLWDNFWNMGESNPDVFTALDFDNKNLDYFLLTSELPSYNHKDYYSYENTDNLLDEYDLYYTNTLGYLESKVRRSSDNLLDKIRPTCIDGRPHYEFINSTQYSGVLPKSVLYSPIVLSEDWYNQLQPDLGHLVVQVDCLECSDSSEINAYGLDSIETRLGYKAKVPLNPNGFRYPINHISVDVVKNNPNSGVSYFARDLIVNETYYTVDSGNLYFTMPVEDIISEKYQLFDDVLHDIRIGKFAGSDIYYDVHIYFDVFVPDSTEETHNLALAQATLYSIMDYFNQYTYAEVSANMISEIAYTETLTFWSTLISVPLVYFGSLAVSSTVGRMFGEAGLTAVRSTMQIFSRPLSSVLISFIKAPVQEMFEEIIHDAFIEAFAEGFADIFSLSEDVGFWLSSLGTSIREVGGALGDIAGKSRADLQNSIAVLKAKKAGDMKTIAEIQQKINHDAQQQLELKLQQEQKLASMKRLMISNFFKGFLMLAPALFFGTFDLFALSGFKRTVGGIQSYAEYKARSQAYKKGELSKPVGNIEIFYQNFQEQIKRPAGINEGNLHTIFREMQETDIMNPPAVDISILFNLNPIQDRRLELADRFNTITFEQHFREWIERDILQVERLQQYKDNIKETRDNYKKIGVQKAEKEIIGIIKEALNEYPYNLRYVNMFGTEFYDPQFILLGITPGKYQMVGLTDPHIFKYDFKTFKSTVEIEKKLREVYALDKFHPQLKGVGDISLELFVLKDKKMTKIPVDENTNLADWLDNNHFSKNDRIIVLPKYTPLKGRAKFVKVNWKEKGPIPSPFTPDFEQFIIDLAYFIESYSLIKFDGSQNVDNEVDKYIYTLGQELLGDRRALYESLFELKSANNFMFSSTRLDRWYILMRQNLIEILESRQDITRSPTKLGMILTHFDKIFFDCFDLFGETSKNEYKTYGRLVLRELALYLYKVGDPRIKISGDEINHLGSIIGYQSGSSAWAFLSFEHERNEPKSIDMVIKHLIVSPIKYLVDKYNIRGSLSILGRGITLDFDDLNTLELDKNWVNTLGSLKSSDFILTLVPPVSSIVSEELMNYKNRIVSIILPYINEVLNFWSLDIALRRYPDTMLKDFTLKVLKDIGFGPQLAKASSFLFGNDDELPRKLRKGIEMRFHSFSSVTHRINTFKLSDFNKLYGSNLSPFKLELIKEKIRKNIRNYFRNVAKVKVATNLRWDVSNTLQSVIYAASLHDNLHIQSGVQFYGLRGKSTQALGISSKGLLVIANEGRSTKEKLETIYRTIAKWHQQEYGDRSKGLSYQSSIDQQERLFSYQEALKDIYNLARRKGFSFDSLTVSNMKLFEALNSKTDLIMNEYDINYWSDSVSKAYINVLQITKLLGIDRLTFRLNPDNSPFDPHHFKAFPFRKMSSHTQDIVVSSKRFHAKYEALKNTYGWRAAESYVDCLTRSLEDLIFLKDDSGNFRDIEDNDVKRVLQKYFGSEWLSVYRGWVSEFTKGMEDIDNYIDTLNKINDLRRKYLPGNKYGYNSEKFLYDKYRNLYKQYRDYLKSSFNKYISKYVSTQSDIDYFNTLFSKAQLKLKI